MERLDLELQRVLELSSFDTGQEEELRPRGESFKGTNHHRQYSQSRFDETTSTVVTRVPNKSVEDLCEAQQLCARAQGDATTPCACDKCLEALGGACGGGAESSPRHETWSDPLPCASFGLIKDLSVSNIHSADDDKTQDFLAKDFASLFAGRKGTGKTAGKGRLDLKGKGGKVIAANTPSEDDCAFVLNSPSSEQSGLGSDVWLPQSLSSASKDPLGSSEGDTSGLDDLSGPLLSPLSDIATLGAESISAAMVTSLVQGAELDPLLGPALGLDDDQDDEEDEEMMLKEVKMKRPYLPKEKSDVDSEQVSLLEMAENLLHMTEEMHTQMQLQQQEQGATGEDLDLAFDLPDPPSDTDMLEFQDSLTLEEARVEASTSTQREGERVAHSSQHKKPKKKKQTSKKERPSFFV